MDTKGRDSFSKCRMFDVNWTTIEWWVNTNQNIEEMQSNLEIKGKFDSLTFQREFILTNLFVHLQN